jgi:phage FluMu protein Com
VTIDVRCPYCGQLEARVEVPASGELQAKCRRARCGKAFTVDLSNLPANLPPTSDPVSPEGGIVVKTAGVC